VSMKGRHHTLESREKTRRSLSGRKLPPEVMEARKRRMATIPVRRSKIPPKDSPVGLWIGKLRLALRARRRYHPQVSEDSLHILGGYLGLFGAPVEGESRSMMPTLRC